MTSPALDRTLEAMELMALQTFIAGVERDIERVKHFAVPAVKALHITRDIEQALIEARFTEFVQTDYKRFRALADEIMRDAAIHRRLVEKKITQLTAQV